MTRPSFTFVFCAEPGKWEARALLLASSLRLHLGRSVPFVAAYPKGVGPTSEAETALACLDVQVRFIENPISDSYPHAFKLAALQVPVETSHLVFLDSDLLCTRRFSPRKVFGLEAAAKPADLLTYPLPDSPNAWDTVYRSLGMRVPMARMMTTHSREATVPYYNAGVVSAPVAAGLGRHWQEVAQRLDDLPAVPGKLPRLDQVSLPLALARAGVKVRLLDERSNLPAHLKQDLDPRAWLVHYHSGEVLASHPRLAGVALRAARLVPGLLEVIAQEADFAFLGYARAPRVSAELGLTASLNGQAVPSVLRLPKPSWALLARRRVFRGLLAMKSTSAAAWSLAPAVRARYAPAAPARFEALVGSGVRIEVDLRDHIESQLFWQHVQEADRGMAAWILSRLATGDGFVDVGACVGSFTLPAARRVGDEGTVWAVEPARDHRAQLLRNVRLNGMCNVRLVAAAAGRQEGEAALQIPGAGWRGMATLFPDENRPASQIEIVRTAPLDDLLPDDFQAAGLKLDVEGSELDVLAGAFRLIGRSRPWIVLEWDEELQRRARRTFHDLAAYCETMGYEPWELGQDGSLQAAASGRSGNLLLQPRHEARPVASGHSGASRNA
jgi:FkbM family methyltransferase